MKGNWNFNYSTGSHVEATVQQRYSQRAIKHGTSTMTRSVSRYPVTVCMLTHVWHKAQSQRHDEELHQIQQKHCRGEGGRKRFINRVTNVQAVHFFSAVTNTVQQIIFMCTWICQPVRKRDENHVHFRHSDRKSSEGGNEFDWRSAFTTARTDIVMWFNCCV